MTWLRKALAHLALSRSEAALIKDSGGAPRNVRGMTLDPRFQFLEANARQRAISWEKITPQILRAQTDAAAAMFGGPRVGGVKREQIYVTGRSHSIPCRLYLPTVRDNDAAMLVYLHFGGGVVGSIACAERLCSLIAKKAGAPVLSIDYRLAPEHRFPAGLEDALAAYNWAFDNSARYGAPVGKVGIGGDSMGGNFTAVITQEVKGARAPVLQLLIYPAVDFANDQPSMRDFADAFPLTIETINFFLANYMAPGADPADLRISPGLTADLSGLPPAFVYTAGFDMLLDQGEAYADRLTAAGTTVTRARFENLPHGFVAFPSVAPAAEAAVQRIAGDVAAALKSVA